MFLLNFLNNCSAIGDEICLLLICKELRVQVANQFGFIWRFIRRKIGKKNAVHTEQQVLQANNNLAIIASASRPMAVVERV
jgi:hypothetical protein